MSGAELRLEGLGKQYGGVAAVRPLNLVVPGGTLVTLLGPSGCGKTTLLRLVAGLEQPSAGRVLLGGRDVTALSAGERNVSMVFQSYALFPHMTVLDNVAYGLVSSGLGRAAAREQAAATLATVGLAGYGGRLPSELSGGQQQRVAVARALVLEPEVLLFDEPLSNLDTRLRRTMREEIRALQQRHGLTVMYVTHDQAEAMAVSDSVVVMQGGEIAQMGTPRQLYEEPASVFVATFMGEANHVRATVLGLEGALARVALGGQELRLPHRGCTPGAVDLVIRPDAIRLGSGTGAGTGLAARVLHGSYMGAHVEYQLETAFGPLLAIIPGHAPPLAAGSAVTFEVDPAGAVLVRGPG